MPPKYPDVANALLNFAPTELGSIKKLPPAQGAAGSLLRAQEVKAVEVTFDDGIARMITCCLNNRSVQASGSGPAINTGPIVGVVEFGVGGAFSRIEFNLPLAYTWAQNGDIIAGSGSQQGNSGVILTVPASSVRVMARNESRLPPIFGSGTIGPSSLTLNGEFEAFIAQGTGDKQCGSLERCIIVVSANSDPLPVNGAAAFGIPRYAKAVRFFREPLATTALLVDLIGDLTGCAINNIPVAAGAIGYIEIPPTYSVIQVTNNGPDPIVGLNAAFVLSL